MAEIRQIDPIVSDESPANSRTIFSQHFIRLMDSRQRTRFRYWLIGELKGKSDHKLVKLWDVLLVMEDAGTIEEIFFSGQGEEAKPRLYRLCGKLQEKLETFWAIEAFRQDQVLQDTTLLGALLDKDRTLKENAPVVKEGALTAYDLRKEVQYIFPTLYQKLKTRLHEQSLKDASYFRAQYERQRMYQAFRISYPKAFRREAVLTRDRVDYWLDAYRCEWYDLMLHPDTPENIRTLEPFAFVNQRKVPVKDAGAMKCYEMLHALLYRENLSQQERAGLEDCLFDALSTHQTSFQRLSYHTFFTRTFNYFSSLASERGAYEDYHKLKSLCMRAITQGIWPASPRYYLAICQTYFGLVLLARDPEEKKGYLDAVKKFIDTYVKQLGSREIGTVKRYMDLAFAFYSGDFPRVRPFADTLGFRDPYYEVNHSLLIQMAEYERGGDPEELLEHIRNTRQGIDSKSGLPGDAKTAYLNLADLIRDLVRADNLEKARALQSEIQKTRPLAGRVWLQAKAGEKIHHLCPPTE